MGDILPRQGKLNVFDTHIGVWEENVDEDAMRAVFAMLREHLERRGWTLGPDPLTESVIQAHDHPRSHRERAAMEPSNERFRQAHRVGRKGDLEMDAQTVGRTLELNFWQNVANVENRNGGRHDFDKFRRMPRPLRLRCAVEMLAAIRFLMSLGYALDPKQFRADEPLGLGVIRRGERRDDQGLSPLERFNKSWGQNGIRRDESGWPGADEFNCYGYTDRDGARVTNGATRYLYWMGRLIRGQVFTNMNGMWSVHLADGSVVTYVNAGELFSVSGDLPPRRNPLSNMQQKTKLREVLARAQRTEDWRRVAAVAKELGKLIQPEGECFILSLAHTKARDGLLTWWGPNCSGYVYRLEDAGRYTPEEIAERRLHDDERNVAVPCAVAEKLAVQVAATKSSAIEPTRPGTDRVVEYRHLRTLRKANARVVGAPQAQAAEGGA